MNDDNIINDCAANLIKGNSILFHSDTNWTIGSYAINENCIQKLMNIIDVPNNNLVLLVNSISMLKKHVSSIHPRIETLLLHHKRPLTIIYDKVINLPFSNDLHDNKLAIRLVHDSFSASLIHKTKHPILSLNLGELINCYSSNIEEIPLHIRSKIDYTCSNYRNNNTDNTLSVMASYTKEGELLIIRP